MKHLLIALLLAGPAAASPNVIYSDEYVGGKWTYVPPPLPRPDCNLVPSWRRDIPSCLERVRGRDQVRKPREVKHTFRDEVHHHHHRSHSQ